MLSAVLDVVGYFSYLLNHSEGPSGLQQIPQRIVGFWRFRDAIYVESTEEYPTEEWRIMSSMGFLDMME